MEGVKQGFIKHLLTTALAIGLFFGSGFALGYRDGHKKGLNSHFPATEKIKEINAGMPTMRLERIEKGFIEGRITGGMLRLAANATDIKDLEPEDVFRIPLLNIRLEDLDPASTFPEGMKFVASKNGKTYYGMHDKRALVIRPENRLFFRTEKEALKKGLKPAK